MAVTYKLLETFDGTRKQTVPDPENEGKTKEVKEMGGADSAPALEEGGR